MIFKSPKSNEYFEVWADYIKTRKGNPIEVQLGCSHSGISTFDKMRMLELYDKTFSNKVAISF